MAYYESIPHPHMYEEWEFIHCGKKLRNPLFQTRLANKNGLLSIDKHPRSQPPDELGVLNPLFKSKSSSKSCHLLRLPTEIRLEIYRLLLTSNVEIRYPIDDELLSMFRRGWRRHGIYPTILETCRLINSEASQVLYGENVFRLERPEKSVEFSHEGFDASSFSHRKYIPVTTWAYYFTNNSVLGKITRLHLPANAWNREMPTECLQNFPALKELRIHFDSFSYLMGATDLVLEWIDGYEYFTDLEELERNLHSRRTVKCWKKGVL